MLFRSGFEVNVLVMSGFGSSHHAAAFVELHIAAFAPTIHVRRVITDELI